MKLSLEQVRHVAQLARLALTPEEELRYQEQLSAILDAMEQLNALDTSQVEPTSHASFGESVLREDRVKPSLGAEVAVANAPASVGTSFAVPKILE
ncbi:MAG TPA: Asp-tRNA(Asn)/Glu-tRNA(Gln) amidotransferase subunit GatC [Myxococcaceae bacterium]|nr:Asp-tRNA(Asn)/Glu-tRNA(Gln) amidotransferase subunit GatC [Myxococcaceae bacterium]